MEYHHNTSAISCAMQIPEMAVGTVWKSIETSRWETRKCCVCDDENKFTKTYNILVPIRGRRTKRSDNVKRAREMLRNMFGLTTIHMTTRNAIGAKFEQNYNKITTL